MGTLKKRKWFYVMNPVSYDMRCDHCWKGDLDDGTGKNITWSEYEGKIWCYDCEVDTDGFGGIFTGPIPIQVAMAMGLIFDRYNIEENWIERVNTRKLNRAGRLCWDPPAEVTKNLLKSADYYTI